MFFAHGSPLEEHGVLEDDAVVVVGACLPGRLAVDSDGALRRVDQVADDAQKRRLPAARGPDQRHELLRGERQVDVLQRRDVAAREGLRHPVDPDDGRRCAHAVTSGARWTNAFSALTTATKKMIPSAAAMMFVAHSSCGSIE